METSDLAVDTQGLEAVAEFLRTSRPFDVLAEEQLLHAVRSLRVAYLPRGTALESPTARDGLRLLRSGAVDLRDGDNKLLDRLGEGESFHLQGLNAEDRVVVARVIEDALIYRLPDAVYQDLRTHNREFDRYFAGQRRRRLRRSVLARADADPLLASVASVMARAPVCIEPDASAADAARRMSEHRVSSIFVTRGGELLGIITDRDLRARVLARDADPAIKVAAIMTAAPRTIAAQATVFEASLLMTQGGFHHLPVLDGGALVGSLTTSDLILARQNDPVYLAQRISRQDSVEAIRQRLADLPQLLVQWTQTGLQARQVSQMLTAVSDSVTRRLIALAERELGPAPAPWAWLAFGSQARGEQLLGADQDNGIVIADTVTDDGLPWYEALAQRVCDGLASCGYPRCPGDVMASNPACRQRLREWEATAAAWARTPTPDALMRVSIFFDLRVVAGSEDLGQALQQRMLAPARDNTIFHAALAASILAVAPPLGIFRRFVVERDGEHRARLDIKKSGVLPVTEIARLHALARGLTRVNTHERLRELSRCGAISVAAGRDLADALECAQRIRLEHQCEQVIAGDPVDNFVDPRRLPTLAREQLRDAFLVIDEAQTALRQTYRAGLG